MTVDLRFLLPDGRFVSGERTVPARSRETVWVNFEDPDLANTAVSVVAESARRRAASSWNGRCGGRAAGGPWTEAHVAAGSTEDGVAWAIAEGEAGAGAASYVLLANVSDIDGDARVTVSFEGGGQA